MIRQRCLLNFYRNGSSWVTSSQSQANLSSKFCEEFNDFYPKFIDNAIEQNKYFDHSYSRDRIKQVSEYFPLAKFPQQGKFLMHAYELLEKPENINSDMRNQAYYLACASEAFVSYFLILDDMYNKSKTRAGKICWHLLPDASNMATNDASILRSFVHQLLRHYIDKSIFTNVIDVFNEMYLAIEMGHVLDKSIFLTKDYNNFTMENYEKISYLKASYFSLTSPLLLTLILSHKANEASFQLVKDLCHDLGVLIQIHNDFTNYLESAGSVTNESKTDIEIGKCAWTSVIALQHFNSEQRKIFNECFGDSDPEKNKQVLNLYDQVNMRKLFNKESHARYETFLRKVRELPTNSTPSPDFF